MTRASTAGLAVVFAVAIATEAIAVAESWGARFWVAGGSAAVTVCALSLVRRKHPLLATATGLVVTGLAIAAARIFHLPTEPGPALALALAVLIGSAVRALPPIPAGVLAAGGLAIVGGAYLAARPGSAGAPGVVAMNLATWLGAMTTGLALRLLDERAAATATQVRQDERLELARELHDVVAHHITGMVIQAQAAQLVAAKSPTRATESLTGIETAGAEALRAMRRVVGLLRDTDDAPPATPGPEHLGDLVERFTRQGTPAHLRQTADTTAWPPEVTSTVYRIVREALTNVARHAPNTPAVTVTVNQDDSGVTVEVTDDAPPGRTVPRATGLRDTNPRDTTPRDTKPRDTDPRDADLRGGDPRDASPRDASPRDGDPRHASLRGGGPRGGYGLLGMRERVETLGGAFDAGPGPGGGWSVRATIPLGRPR